MGLISEKIRILRKIPVDLDEAEMVFFAEDTIRTIFELDSASYFRVGQRCKACGWISVQFLKNQPVAGQINRIPSCTSMRDDARNISAPIPRDI